MLRFETSARIKKKHKSCKIKYCCGPRGLRGHDGTGFTCPTGPQGMMGTTINIESTDPTGFTFDNVNAFIYKYR